MVLLPPPLFPVNMRTTESMETGVKINKGWDMKCHKCGYVARAGDPGPKPWFKITQHRKTCDADNYVNGLPFWKLEQRLLDSEYAILWSTSAQAERDIGPVGRKCWR